LEDNAPREPFQLSQLAAQPSVVADGDFHHSELLWAQGDGHGFLGHFASPLVAGAPAATSGPILHRPLADQTDLAQGLAQLLILQFQSR
jgi:hypothetical protein